ncbi:hypothetical protein J6590_077682 [Homalodisca vitripennis]|nr:hypothetical protein J6590_077682 [Homalodisca vitripennis]
MGREGGEVFDTHGKFQWTKANHDNPTEGGYSRLTGGRDQSTVRDDDNSTLSKRRNAWVRDSGQRELEIPARSQLTTNAHYTGISMSVQHKQHAHHMYNLAVRPQGCLHFTLCYSLQQTSHDMLTIARDVVVQKGPGPFRKENKKCDSTIQEP